MQKRNRVRKLRAAAVSAEYGIPEQTLANWRCQGRGPAYERVSVRLILYDRGDLERFFLGKKVIPGQENG